MFVCFLNNPSLISYKPTLGNLISFCNFIPHLLASSFSLCKRGCCAANFLRHFSVISTQVKLLISRCKVVKFRQGHDKYLFMEAHHYTLLFSHFLRGFYFLFFWNAWIVREKVFINDETSVNYSVRTFFIWINIRYSLVFLRRPQKIDEIVYLAKFK